MAERTGCYFQHYLTRRWWLLSSLLTLWFCLLVCCDEVSCHAGSESMERLKWPGTEGDPQLTALEEQKPSVHQPARNWILPTIMWVNLEAALSPAEPGDDYNSGWHFDNCLWDTLSQGTQLSCTWIPDSQTLWHNTWCSKPLNLGVIFYTAFNNECSGEMKVLSTQTSFLEGPKLC